MKVEHDVKNRKFYMVLGDYEASLMYAEKGKVLDFYHIYVPEPFRNRGFAGRILIEAFEYAEKNGYKVVPTCPFISGDFLPRFQKYQKITDFSQKDFPFSK